MTLDILLSGAICGVRRLSGMIRPSWAAQAVQAGFDPGRPRVLGVDPGLTGCAGELAYWLVPDLLTLS